MLFENVQEWKVMYKNSRIAMKIHDEISTQTFITI